MVEKTVPDLFKNSNPPTLEVQRWPNRINIEKTTSRHIIIKMAKLKIKREL